MNTVVAIMLLALLSACAPMPPKAEVVAMPEPEFRVFVYDELAMCRRATGVNTALTIMGLASGVTGLIADMRLAGAAEKLARP